MTEKDAQRKTVAKGAFPDVPRSRSIREVDPSVSHDKDCGYYSCERDREFPSMARFVEPVVAPQPTPEPCGECKHAQHVGQCQQTVVEPAIDGDVPAREEQCACGEPELPCEVCGKDMWSYLHMTGPGGFKDTHEYRAALQGVGKLSPEPEVIRDFMAAWPVEGQFSFAEQKAISEMGMKLELSHYGVVRQAIRCYQLIVEGTHELRALNPMSKQAEPEPKPLEGVGKLSPELLDAEWAASKWLERQWSKSNFSRPEVVRLLSQYVLDSGGQYATRADERQAAVSQNANVRGDAQTGREQSVSAMQAEVCAEDAPARTTPTSAEVPLVPIREGDRPVEVSHVGLSPEPCQQVSSEDGVSNGTRWDGRTPDSISAPSPSPKGRLGVTVSSSLESPKGVEGVGQTARESEPITITRFPDYPAREFLRKHEVEYAAFRPYLTLYMEDAMEAYAAEVTLTLRAELQLAEERRLEQWRDLVAYWKPQVIALKAELQTARTFSLLDLVDVIGKLLGADESAIKAAIMRLHHTGEIEITPDYEIRLAGRGIVLPPKEKKQ